MPSSIPGAVVSQTSALVAAGLATVCLSVVHLSVPALRRRIASASESVVAAVGGGVAAAYVFIHLLPELARGNREVGEVLGDAHELSALADVLLFITAFGGFLLLYGLDHLAARRGPGGGVFAVHVGVYALYNGLITYALPTQFEAGAWFAGLFVVAMAVHFFLSDRALAEHHGDRFRTTGRPILVAALVGGFGLAWGFAPTRNVVVSVMLSVLAGFVLYNVFSDELPSQQRVRYPVFAASASAYALLLLAAVAIEG